jgi:integrase
VKLTEVVVAQLALRRGEQERQVADAALPGLRLRLRRTRDGVTRKWIYRYRNPAGVVVFSRDVAGTTLAGARKWAGELQAKRRIGRDPAQERAAGQQLVAQSFGVMLQPYLELKAGLVRPSTRKEIERHLLVYCKSLHRLPLTSVTTATLSALLAKLASDPGVATADAVRRTLSAFWSWAVLQKLVTSSPALGVERRKIAPRTRTLNADEIAKLWRATAGDDDFSAIVRMLLFTGMRVAEVGRLHWAEIRSDRIELPGSRTKNNRPFKVPLSPYLQAVLAARSQGGRGEGFVFGRVGTGFSGWSKSKRLLDAQTGIDESWRLHDLRRTAATGMGELGISPHVIEAALNHVTSRPEISTTYNRSNYEPEVRSALESWQAHVLEIAEGRVAGDRVVPLRRRK